MNPYVLADSWLQQLLSDDVPHGDLTSWVLDLGQQDGQMQFSARYAMVLCGSEEAWRSLSTRVSMDGAFAAPNRASSRMPRPPLK